MGRGGLEPPASAALGSERRVSRVKWASVRRGVIRLGRVFDDRLRLNRRGGSEMKLCQLLLEAGRQGHVFELFQTIFFLGEASREEVRHSPRPR